MNASREYLQRFKRCIRCDYDLQGTPHRGRCPECGTGFHTKNVVVHCWWLSHWPRLWWDLPILGVVLAVGLLALAVARGVGRPCMSILLLALAIIAFAATVMRGRSLLHRFHGRAPDRLVLFRRTVGVFHNGQRAASFRWRAITSANATRTRSGWRLKIEQFSPARIRKCRAIEVVILGEEHLIASLLAEVRGRMSAAAGSLEPSAEKQFEGSGSRPGG